MSARGLGCAKTLGRQAHVEQPTLSTPKVLVNNRKTTRKQRRGRTRFPCVNAISEFLHGQGQKRSPPYQHKTVPVRTQTFPRRKPWLRPRETHCPRFAASGSLGDFNETLGQVNRAGGDPDATRCLRSGERIAASNSGSMRQVATSILPAAQLPKRQSFALCNAAQAALARREHVLLRHRTTLLAKQAGLHSGRPSV
jgi:hypothetical protein